MALGDSYATRAELKRRLDNLSATTWDLDIDNALAVASRGIETVCDRQFNQATSASARIYYPCGQWLAEVDDFYTTVGLAIATDAGDAGTYTTIWASTDYQLEPLNGVVGGELGWPSWKIRAVLGRTFPTLTRRAPLQVTAKWGWTAVPAGVKEACLAAAEDIYKLKEAPWGVANLGEWGALRVRANPVAMGFIARYALNPVLVR